MEPEIRGIDHNVESTHKIPSQEKQLTVGEILNRRDYQNIYTVLGEDLIKEIKLLAEKADIARLESTINKALPLIEGLEFGVNAESYGIKKENITPPQSEDELKIKQDQENAVYARLKNQFFTVEDSVDRGNVGYLKDAMLDALGRPIRELEEWKQHREEWIAGRKVLLEEVYDQENIERIENGFETRTLEQVNQIINQRLQLEIRKRDDRMNAVEAGRERLLALELHVKSRSVMDSAFRQRQYTAFDKDAQSSLKQSIGLATSEPDGPHWHGFYQTNREWGCAVDKVEREMVKIGFSESELRSFLKEKGFPDDRIENDITKREGKLLKGAYKSNLNTEEFKQWMKIMLDASEIDGVRRMDVVWAAWRQICIKELTGKFCMGIREVKDTSKDTDGIAFDANPPYVGDLSSWLHFPEEHRANEFGWNYSTFDKSSNPNWDGNMVGRRTQSYKGFSHSGHPINIGHIFPNGKFGKYTKIGNYMEFSEIPGEQKHDEPFKGRKLFDIWWGYKGKIRNQDGIEVEYIRNGLDMSDPDFPWIDTDYSGRKLVPDEAAQGSFGFWCLQRGRAASVLKECLGLPDIKGIDSLAGVEKWRSWHKLGMVKPKDNFDKDTDNPVAWRVLGLLAFYVKNERHGSAVNKIFSLHGQEKIGADLPGSERTTSRATYYANLIRFGLISEKEAKWIENKLNP